MAQWIDICPWPPLEDALAAATNRPRVHFAQQRLAGLAVNPDAAWPRNAPAWCPLCVAQDIAAYGEVYSRKAWTFGGYLICPQQRCLLIASCSLCLRRVAQRPVNGRLRLWCEQCDRCADNALAPRRIPFWPFGTPQQHRRCVSIRLTAEARPLLLQVQSDLLAALRGSTVQGALGARLEVGGFHRRAAPAVVCHAGTALGGLIPFQQGLWSVDPSWSLPDEGVGGAERRIRDNERRRATETEAGRRERERREQRETSSQRFAIGRLIDGYVAPAKPRLSRTQIDASFAVYAMRGAGTSIDRVPAGCEDT